MSTVDLKQLLKDRKMRLTDLAQAVGVDKATVTRWNKRQIPPEKVNDVAKATGISPQKLRPDLAQVFSRKGAA